MSKPVKALVKKSLLRWARETSGYTIEEVAHRVNKKPTDIERWERGIDRPYTGQLNQMADMFGRPISDFYLPKPPAERPLPHDFRRSANSPRGAYSPDLRKQLRFAQERHDLMLAIDEELETEATAFKQRVRMQDNPEMSGHTIRNMLGVTLDMQKSWNAGYPAYKKWRSLAEQRNFLVFQFENVEVDEAWGFSIHEKHFPIVGINKKLAPNGRIFTMLHEITHLLLGQSSVCDLDDFTERSRPNLRVEVYCNRSAAAALLPEEDFLSRVRKMQVGKRGHCWDERSVKALASYFGASEEAVARRLLTCDFISADQYREYRAKLKARFAKQAAKRKEGMKNRNAKGGQPAPQRTVSDYGATFVKAVLRSLYDQRITLADASQYLRLHPNAINSVEGIIFND